MFSMLRLSLTAAVITLGLVGCGKDICDRLADDAEECGGEVSDADMDSCKESLSDCSGKDNRLLEDYFDCLDDAGAGVCQMDDTGTDEDAMNDMFACATPLISLSDECLAAMESGF